MKVDWELVWQKYGVWAKGTIPDDHKKKIQSLVEAQLRRKKK